MLNDLRYAVRMLLKNPGFAVVAMLTLALGIGLNTAMFSMINTMLLKPLDFPEAQNLYRVNRTTAQQREGSHSPANFCEIEVGSKEFADLAVIRYWGFTLSEPHQVPVTPDTLRVSRGFFEVLGVKPELGRMFLPEEDQPGRNNVILISHEFWMSHYSGDPQVVGRTVRLDGEPAVIVGVLPEIAAFAMIFGPMDLFRPLGLTSDQKADWTDNEYVMIGRYRPGFSAAQTTAHFEALASRLAADHPKEDGGSGLRIVSLQSTSLGDTGRQITLMLLGLSGFVLLIACANLGNLLLARAVARAREFAIRAALGASRLRLIRLMVVECVLLAGAGGSLGILISVRISQWMARRLSGDGPVTEFSLDWRVITFAFLASLVTALFFSVAPAWLISSVRVNDTLKSGTRGSTGGRTHHRFRQALIVGQFALALVLLAGAVFFTRGIDQLLHHGSGWNAATLLSGNISLPTGKYPEGAPTMAFYSKLQQRLTALPGVQCAAISYRLPIFGFPGPRKYIVEGRPPPMAGQEPAAYVNGVTPHYFDTVGTHLLQGRDFSQADRVDSTRVVIINQSMAQALFPNEAAVGHHLLLIGDKYPSPLQIVGVVEDVHFMLVSPSPIHFQLYQPLTQETWNYVAVTVSTLGDAGSLMQPFRQTVASLDPDMPVQNLSPVPIDIERNNDDLKMIMQLLVAFAALGLFLATLGIYSVIARIVGERTGEIGIRMALGAQMADIVRMILGTGMRMAIIGAVLGLAGAFVLMRLLTSAMPGLATDNTAAIAGATVLLIVFAGAACLIPARRAAKVDPMVALRCE